MKPNTILTFSLVLIIIFQGCKPETSQKSKRVLKDMAGRLVEVPDTIHTIFATRPAGTLLYAAAPDLLICRSMKTNKKANKYLLKSYLDLPYKEESPEELVKLKPDIIINFFSIDSKSIDEANRFSQKTGIPVFLLDADLSKNAEMFDLLGELIGRKSKTDSLKNFAVKYLDIISSRMETIPEKQKIRVYYAEGENGLKTDPSGSIHSQIIDLVGAKNVAETSIVQGSGMTQVSMEQIMIWNPDVILCWTMGTEMNTYNHITGDPVWKKLKAVKEKRVYQIPMHPFGWFDRPPGTNRLLGHIWTAQLLYPDIYELDINQAVKEYFDLFYHYKLSEEELTSFIKYMQLHKQKKTILKNFKH